MKTDDLIRGLSGDLRPRRGPGVSVTWAAGWLLGTAAVAAAAFYVLPWRADLSAQTARAAFRLESALWLSGFCLASVMAYLSALPGALNPRQQSWALLPMIPLALLALRRLSLPGLPEEFLRELDIVRGGCGPLIFLIGLLQAGILMVLARRAAPTRLALTGGWIAASSACLGLFLMQFFCARDNFLHLFLWHFPPAAALVVLGAVLGRRLLRW